MRPEDVLRMTTEYAKQLREAQTHHVTVGLQSGNADTKAYENGQTILEVGAAHEFGLGNLPQRSFLRVPFQKKQDLISQTIQQQFRDLLQGKTKASRALGLVGAQAVNASKGAFTSKGYGEWDDISDVTKDRKGSSQVMIDKGLLRNAIAWQVRKN